MPQVFKIGSYIFYFWLDEGKPLEPVHIHVAEDAPRENATKIWISKSGRALVANNNSRISEKDLRKLVRLAEANAELIKEAWVKYFDEIYYYC